MGKPDGGIAILVAACAVLASACGARSWLGNANDRGDASADDAGVIRASDDAESGASDAALEGARPALPFALDVVGGGYHTCARLTDGTVRCWGDNALGQLGNGTHTGAQNPAPVSNLSGVTALASGPNHTCAVIAGGAVTCWGDNTYGQLGDGSLRSSNVPVAVLRLRGAVALALGDRHTCAVKSDGSALCWGDNYYGQIGTGMSFCCTCGPPPDGGVCSPGYALVVHDCSSAGTQGCLLVSSEDSVTPTSVAGSHGLALVSAGVAHTCGLISADGTVLCWGSNDHGQLGNGRRANYGGGALDTIDPGPALVPNLAGATGLAAGAEHVCALISDGAVACWGSNSSGQLGNGTVTDSLVPVVVPQLSGVKGLVSASGHTCAVLAGGAVECWGTNDAYQLGNNMTNPADCGGLACSSTPVPVIGLRNAIALGGGSEHTCAVLSDGTVWCWGLNAYGQLGNGTLADTSTPEAVRW